MSGRFRKENGAALVEYVMLLAFIGLVSIGAVVGVGEGVVDVYDDVVIIPEPEPVAPVELDPFAGIPVGGWDTEDPNYELYVICHIPPNAQRSDGRITVKGYVYPDHSPDGRFDWGNRGGAKYEPDRDILFERSYDQDWYGDLYITMNPNGPYYRYRPSHVFPPGWNPDDPRCSQL